MAAIIDKEKVRLLQVSGEVYSQVIELKLKKEKKEGIELKLKSLNEKIVKLGIKAMLES